MELFKFAIPQHMNAARVRVYRRESNPAILDELFQRSAGVDYLVQPVGRRLDYKKNSDGLVDFNHLPGQPGA